MTTHARWEDDTVPLRRPAEDTLELPVVDEPTAPVRVPAPSAPQARRARGLLVAPSALVIVAALVVVAAVALVGGALGMRGRSGGGGAGSSGVAALAIRNIRSVDPSGGSGFHRVGNSWRTQSYRSAEFGGLKSGVGLLLDLGRAHRVTAVTVTVAGSGTTIQLRAGDTTAGAPGSFPTVAARSAAGGTVMLQSSTTSAHRYWLLWVPKLGSDGGGYRAVLRGLSVRG